MERQPSSIVPSTRLIWVRFSILIRCPGRHSLGYQALIDGKCYAVFSRRYTVGSVLVATWKHDSGEKMDNLCRVYKLL
uniref:Uncharacterized protein n=1 Tax=Arundo donax TaxID=35708 RepID=A0A0A9BTP7_ARUDO